MENPTDLLFHSAFVIINNFYVYWTFY